VSRSFRHLDKIGRKAISKEIKSDLQENSHDYCRTRTANYPCQISKLSIRNGFRTGKYSAREWQILKRYQRGLQSLLDMTLCLYVLGLSLRDLQEALYHLLGSVLSLTAVNRVTPLAQRKMEARRQSLIEQTPPILIVDGVWIDILYTLDEFKLDRAGHQRQVRQAQERVILAAMAVWPDGTYHLLHYEIAEGEDSQSWFNFFEHLIERGLNPQTVKLIVSDGISALPGVITQCLPNAQQQRCTTHKVRGMKRYLTYQQLSTLSEVTAAHRR
jgi:transposase-like protein